MYVSALELFSIGIGPSSSHTVGPMRAGADFARRVLAALPQSPARVGAELYGSLAATGLGHGTPDALVAGLSGLEPETCDPAAVRGAWSGHPAGRPLLLGGVVPVPFDSADVVLAPRVRRLGHPNTLRLRAWADGSDEPALDETYESIGGGFVRRAGEEPPGTAGGSEGPVFRSAAELLALCGDGASIADVAWAAETARRDPADVVAGLDAVWAAMRACVDAGLTAEGALPGGLGVRRRAAAMRASLEAAEAQGRHVEGDWLQVYALAVNEENAAGGRVVTAPTNGAAGILPAVLRHYWRSEPSASIEGVRSFLLTAAAVGSLIKANASISGAEGGCQAEVGSACAMAAAGLCAVLGGTPAQVENAAEIAMEHHLGLTCDPIAGLVQVPCIERNAIAATTAVTAARLALHGDGSHIVSLDAVIETMRQTGADMSDKYKETSRGGLAVNVVEC
ncbi:L-serine ammonia-lyase [Puerhibacterium puerhi]|uniref:L-serine ammonia-lyase n=1 Tax=Puerhibacterium puerhi TaxID=2692623 RepID=UPI00135783AE|nr:L-serine ammonia-lyase [Puerhibacterium puerhi]